MSAPPRRAPLLRSEPARREGVGRVAGGWGAWGGDAAPQSRLRKEQGLHAEKLGDESRKRRPRKEPDTKGNGLYDFIYVKF